ncbi:MAG TPA: hypothetical protein VGK82_15045 [Pyrinomonadaceae bacterium]
MKLLCELLEFHELLKALVDSKAQVLAYQRDVNVFLVGLDYRV